MSNISNVRAYFQREYRDASGVWHKEKVKEMGQFKPYDNNKHYYDYATIPTTQRAFYESVTINNKNVYANPKYTPSGAYFPEKFYPFSEIINDDDIDYMREFLSSGFSLFPTKSYTTYTTFRSKRIIFKTLKNWYIFPYFQISFGSLSSVTGNRDASIKLYIMTCKYPPEDVQYNDELRKWTHKVSEGTYSVMKYGRIYETNGEYSTAFIENLEIFTELGAGLEKCISTFNQNISNFKKIKFYPFLNSNANPFSFDKYSKQFYTNYQLKNYNVDISNSRETTMFSLCFDTSNMKDVIEKCFYAKGSIACDLITEYIYNPSEKAPDDKFPGMKDDPNDEDPGFNPSDPDIDDEDDRGGDGDHDDSSDIIPIPPKPSIDASGVGLVTIWNPTSSQLEHLSIKLWEPSAWDAIKQYFTNPLEAILGLSIIPVAPTFSNISTIHLGGYDTKISSNIVSNDYVDVDLGSIPINRYYGSYLDYDGFTKISCYLPYIGEVDINPDQVMKKVLGLKYRINVITGDCVAILSIDGSVFASYSGNCARQIPICQSDFSSIIQSSVSLITTVGMAVATGGASASAGTAMQLGQAEAPDTSSPKATSLAKSLVSDVMSSKLSYKHASQLGLGAGQLSPQVPFLTITRPNLDLPQSYKSFVGYPSNMNLHLGKCIGFTQVEAINLSVPSASKEEVSEIIELLLAGVIF